MAIPTTVWVGDEFRAARPSHTFETTGRCVVRRRVRDERAASAISGGEVSTSMTRPFRFGVVCPLTTDLRAWRDRVRRIADSGYSTLLMPDVPAWQPAPGPTLALAAGLADIRVRHLGVRFAGTPCLDDWRGKRTRCRCSARV